MIALRFALFAAWVAVLAACAREKIGGSYRDEANSALRYHLSDAGTWSAELTVEVPAGVFPHGAGQRLEGTFTRSGEVLELVCTNAARQDPISGQFLKEAADLAASNHKLLVAEEVLVPIGPRGEKEALFATDLNPLGARKLVREDKKP